MEGLLPTLKELQGTVNTVRNDLNRFNETINNLTEKVSHLEEHQNTLFSKMDEIKSKLDSIKKKKFKAVESQLEEHMTQTTSELTALQNMFIVSLASQTSHLNYKLNALNANMRENFSFVKEDLNVSMNEELRAIYNRLEEHKTQMTSELAGLQRNMTSILRNTLLSHTQQLTTLMELTQLSTKVDTLDSKLASVNASTRKQFRAMESQLEEHRQQTTSELAGLQINIISSLNTTNIQLQTTKTEISTKVDTLDSKLVAVNASIREDLSCIKKNLSTTMNKINDQLAEHEDHMTTELMELDQNLEQNFTLQLKNSYGYITPYRCGDTGGWRRVVYLNTTDPNTNCPSGWELTSHSKRTCGIVSTGSLTCDSVTFPVSGGDYTRVCGRIKAYQYRATDGFEAFHEGRVTTIDGAYVSGVSLTHGSPRQHIWTFAAGAGENQPTRIDACPCDTTVSITIPPFVGGDYFCESGWNSGRYIKDFYPDDPLWDGDGCTGNSTCCSFNNPPYFTKQLPRRTSDDIEARLCRLQDRDDTPIELIELYVQ